MGAQSGGLKNAAFQLDTKQKAYQGAARRRTALERAKGSFGGIPEPLGVLGGDAKGNMKRMTQDQMQTDDEKGIKKGGNPKGPGFPPKNIDIPGQNSSYQDAKKEWYDNRNKTGESFDDFGKRWNQGSPEVGIGGGPGKYPPLFPGGGQGGGGFPNFRAFLDRLQDVKGGK